MYEPALDAVAERIVTDLADVSPDETVLVLTDSELEPVGRAIARAARAIDATTVLSVMERIAVYGREPPAVIAASMKHVDITFAVLATSLTHTDARREAAATGTRTFIIRGVDFDTMLEGGINTDYDRLHERTVAVNEHIRSGDTVHVESPAGTDVTFSIAERTGFVLDGRFGGGVRLTNGVPTGEAPVAPVEGTAHGRIVIDYSMDNIGRVDEPIVLELREGHVAAIEGGEAADRLRSIVEEADDAATNLAEFAIGTNPDARLTGVLAEDKKAEGTVHFALGDNMSLDGSVRSDVHLDGMVLEPTVRIDGDLLVEAGRITA